MVIPDLRGAVRHHVRGHGMGVPANAGKDRPCTLRRLMQRAAVRMGAAMLVTAAIILPVVVFVIKGMLVK